MEPRFFVRLQQDVNWNTPPLDNAKVFGCSSTKAYGWVGMNGVDEIPTTSFAREEAERLAVAWGEGNHAKIVPQEQAELIEA